MKWLWLLIFFAALLAGYAPQLRTRLRPAYPAVRRIKRRVWSYQRPRWAIAVAIVRVM